MPMDKTTLDWLRYLSPAERGEAISLLQEQAVDNVFGGPTVSPEDALAHLEEPDAL